MGLAPMRPHQQHHSAMLNPHSAPIAISMTRKRSSTVPIRFWFASAVILAATAGVAGSPVKTIPSTITLSYGAGDGCSGSVTDSDYGGPVPVTYTDTCVGATEGAATMASAEATLTLLKLLLNSDGTFPVGVSGSFAQVRVTDTITVTGGSGSGTLVFNWAFDGTLAVSESFYTYIFMRSRGADFAHFMLCGDGVSGPFCPPDDNSSVGEIVSISIPFVFGIPLDLDWSLEGRIGSPCVEFNNCNTPQTGSGTINFADTVELQPVIVLDSTQTQVNANVTSDSGFVYPVTATAASQTINVTVGAPATAAFNASFQVAATASSDLDVAIGATGACSIDAGTVTMTSGTGTCAVTFDQAGDANYLPAPQIVQTTTAEKASQAINVTQGAPATAAFNSTFPVSATAPGGSVVISVQGVCTLNAGLVTMTGATGTCKVKFEQGGNLNYLAAQRVLQTTTAQKASQVITVTQSAPPTAVFRDTFPLAATAPGGVVAISVSGPCAFKNGIVTIKKPNPGNTTCTVTFTQAGNANYLAAPQVVQATTVTAAAPAPQPTWLTVFGIDQRDSPIGEAIESTRRR